jgi:ATP-binding cassette, subfamily B, bacterial
VLDHGRVAELGDHDGLMGRGGRYARLVEAREGSVRQPVAA